ncbi:hypothetical protein AQI84_19450 [Streptomyces griseorubiginosus]|nr:hypothetical protein AQI84_19450 [Streptomyces griseorubiginosus]
MPLTSANFLQLVVVDDDPLVLVSDAYPSNGHPHCEVVAGLLDRAVRALELVVEDEVLVTHDPPAAVRQGVEVEVGSGGGTPASRHRICHVEQSVERTEVAAPRGVVQRPGSRVPRQDTRLPQT